jgi:periplasmic copper chaperone A
MRAVPRLSVTEAVSEIDWTSTTGAIKPGEFDDFRLSVCPLPQADEMIFKAVQHYSDGKDAPVGLAWVCRRCVDARQPQTGPTTVPRSASDTGHQSSGGGSPALE